MQTQSNTTKPAADTDERRVVPIEEAISRLPDGPTVHTLMQGGFAVIGCDHSRDGLIASMRECGVEESGESACRMGHTLVIVNYNGSGPLFIEARPGGDQ